MGGENRVDLPGSRAAKVGRYNFYLALKATLCLPAEVIDDHGQRDENSSPITLIRCLDFAAHGSNDALTYR